jgi:hypothetical protein
VLIVGGKWFVRLERKGEFCFAEIKAPELTKRVARKCSVCNKGGALVDVYALSQKFVLCSQCQLKPNEPEAEQDESEQDDSEQDDSESDEAYSETEGAGKRKRVRDAAPGKRKRVRDAAQDLGGDSEPDLGGDAAQDLGGDSAQDLGRDSEPRLVGNPTLPRKRKQKPKPLFARDSGFSVLNDPPNRFKEKPKKIKFNGRLGGGKLPANVDELRARRIAKFG